MNAIRLLAGFVTIAFVVAGSNAFAQSKPHIAGGVQVVHTEINVALVAEGWSVVRLLRARVVNENAETVGDVHDAIVTPGGGVSYVIVSVGGFLGLGRKLIALPAGAFEVKDDWVVVLPGATKDMLKKLPEFVYAR